MAKKDCLALKYANGQIICHACGLNWDSNDPEPPACQNVDRRTKAAKAHMQFVETERIVKGLPDELPTAIIVEMTKAYLNNSNESFIGQITGMRAAYRVMMDKLEL